MLKLDEKASEQELREKAGYLLNQQFQTRGYDKHQVWLVVNVFHADVNQVIWTRALIRNHLHTLITVKVRHQSMYLHISILRPVHQIQDIKICIFVFTNSRPTKY
jgi:hypothetical protein